MIRICHLLDSSAGWEQRVGLDQLLTGVPTREYANLVAALGTAAPANLAGLTDAIRTVPGAVSALAVSAAPSLVRYLTRSEIQLIHAWGIRAALAARAASKLPIVAELSDPSFSRYDLKALRTLAGTGALALVCNSATVRRRAVEGGVPPEICVVIRPGVDFGVINKYRRSSIRKDLGLGPDDMVAIVSEPATRGGGHFEAFLAVKLAAFFVENSKLLLPGVSREQRRIVRFSAALPPPTVLVPTGASHPFERLVAIGDVLIMANRRDGSATPIAWAMGANVAVVGAAVYSVAELVAHKVNGLLFKPGARRSAAAAISRLIRDRKGLAEVSEVARGQAYDVFGVSRRVTQYKQLYTNMRAGAPAGVDIVDSACSF